MENNKSDKRLLLSEIKSRAVDQEGNEADATSALVNYLKTGRLHAKSPAATDAEGFKVVPNTISEIDWGSCSFDWIKDTVSLLCDFSFKNRAPGFRQRGLVKLREVQLLASEVDQIWPIKSGRRTNKKNANNLLPIKVANFINSQPPLKKTLAQWKAIAEAEFGREIQDHNIWRKVTKLIDMDHKFRRGEKLLTQTKSGKG